MKILYWLLLRARGLFTIYTKHSCRSGGLTAKRSVFFFGLILVAAPVFAVSPTYDIPVVIAQSTPKEIFTCQLGDKLRIEARLTSVDLREDMENEPLYLEIDVPYQGNTARNYVQLYIFDFNCSDSNPSKLTGWISNFDSDEQAELTVHVNPIDPVYKDPELVQRLLQASRQYSDAGDRYATAARICRNVSPVRVDCEFLQSVATLYHGVSRVYEEIARDPADPNYTVIANPIVLSLPFIDKPPAMDQFEADIWNQLIDNMQQTIGVGRALIISINRATGAMAAGDLGWKAIQVQAALDYAQQLRVLLGDQRRHLQNLEAYLVAHGRTPIVITQNAVRDYQAAVYVSQWSHDLLYQGLTQLGFSAEDISLARQWTWVKDPFFVANAGHYPKNIIYPTLLNSMRYLQDSFTNFSAADTIPPTTTVTIAPLANADGWNNTDVTVTLSAIDNPGGSGVKQIQYTLSGAQIGSQTISGNSASVTVTSEGTTTLTYFAIDNAGNAETPKTITLNLDKTPPMVRGLPTNCVLWPPNHQMVTVGTVSAEDAISGLMSLDVNTMSSEPQDSTKPDMVITGNTVQLRAWRLGNGPGRIYTINATARDMANNVTNINFVCTVPHDQR